MLAREDKEARTLRSPEMMKARRLCARMDPLREWLRLAFSPSVVRRGLAYALVVGAILIAINHGDVILAGEVDRGRLLRMGLTVLVPYLVSTTSSVAALRESARANDR